MKVKIRDDMRCYNVSVRIRVELEGEVVVRSAERRKRKKGRATEWKYVGEWQYSDTYPNK